MKKLLPVLTVPLTAWVLSAPMAARAGSTSGGDGRDDGHGRRHFDVVEATIPEMQQAVRSHAITSKKLVQLAIARRI
jgi:hypothetical protein